MAFDPYLLTRKRGCYKAPLSYDKRSPIHVPECTVDPYTRYFRQRWAAILDGPCRLSAAKNPPIPLCIRDVKYPLKSKALCDPTPYAKVESEYKRDYPYPYSHNNIDDCCKAPCPCEPEERSFESPKISWACRGTGPCGEFDDMTTNKWFFPPKETPPPPVKYPPKPWEPCCCPMESATSYRTDYHHKRHQPNGPVVAEAIKNGMWSMDQFSHEAFSEDTEQKSQFPEKFCYKRDSLRKTDNLKSGEGPFEYCSETCASYPPKPLTCPHYPEWLLRDPTWIPPDNHLDKCTTYKHFYRRYPPRPAAPPEEIKSPAAIPFPTVDNLWYTCCDPVVPQTTPVEMKDDDPWPYVRPCPIKYQDNLQTDPCAPFRDDTTQKADYTPKRTLVCRERGPEQGYTPPILPFNDDTTQKIAFPAYSPQEYKEAKQVPGNPCGKYWGPFKCPPETDKCLPRFPAPYGNPLKPYTKPCPCGPFDDRSTYYSDFKFRNKETLQALEADMCEKVNVPKGVSLYRHDYIQQDGKRAARMPPPEGKGHRCMHPTKMRDLDTLYRINYNDFWKVMERKNLKLYIGKPTIKVRRRNDEEDYQSRPQEAFEIIATPPGTTVEDVLKGRVDISTPKD